MKYISEYRDPVLVKTLLRRIHTQAKNLAEIKLMEVCGTHTMAIAQHGLRVLLPENVKLISGPGCPVCVTSNAYLDKAVALCKRKEVILTTFGDIVRVPGSSTTLEKERASGADVRIVYSTMDALYIAEHNPHKKVVFLGVGFETTAPTVAAAILTAFNRNLGNFFILCAHKTMPAPMMMLASSGRIKISGFICPAHVSTIIGTVPYEPLAAKFNKACVVAGFEPLDILEAISMLLQQIIRRKSRVEIQYSRVATREGNHRAKELLNEVFNSCDAEWRGIGIIPGSGLKISNKYAAFDAETVFSIEAESTKEAKGCICGDIMQGITTPNACTLYGTVCTPDSPVGACMVSSEGACAAWYKYNRDI